jgi:hypothetical protein
MRTLVAASLLLAIVAGCAGSTASPGPSSPAPTSPTPTPTLVPGTPASATAEPAADLETALKVRDALGLRSDRDWVEMVQNDPASILSNLGILVSADELAQLRQQQSMADDYSALVAYGIRHADQYGGMYIDQPIGLPVMLFTGDLDAHRAAINALPRGAAVDVRPCTFTEAELTAVLADLDFDALRRQGIDVISASLDTINNVVTVEAKAASPAAKTALEERYGGKLVATIQPLPGAWSNQAAGNGWQLVANMERGADWAYAARGATSEVEWTALWNELSPGLDRPAVDFSHDMVAVFGVGMGGGCREVRLDDVVIDPAAGAVYPRTSDPLAPRVCDDMLSGAAMFVVALARDGLPAFPFKVYWQDPAMCPGCAGSEGFVVQGN